MEVLIAYLPTLACAAVMFFCVRHMSAGNKGTEERADASSNQKIAELREELARLRAERALVSAEKEHDD